MNTTDFALLALTSLFVMINPIGVMVLFSSMSAQLAPDAARRIAGRAAGFAAAILVAFALSGRLIFDFFQISVESLRIAGGVIFFIMGYEMLQARLSRMDADPIRGLKTGDSDISLSPLAIPMIAGPGAIATVIILVNDHPGLAFRSIMLGCIGLLCLITYGAMVGARRLVPLMGPQANRVILRLMGLIVMVIAVEFFFAGLRPIVRDMLRPL